MKGIWENNWFMIPVSLFFGFGIAMALLVPYGDEILFFNDLRREPFIAIFKFFSWCGESWIWIVIGLAALFWRYRYTLLIALTGLITPFVFILKDNIGTDRPITYFQKEGKIETLVTVPEIVLKYRANQFPFRPHDVGIWSVQHIGINSREKWQKTRAFVSGVGHIGRTFQGFSGPAFFGRCAGRRAAGNGGERICLVGQ